MTGYQWLTVFRKRGNAQSATDGAMTREINTLSADAVRRFQGASLAEGALLPNDVDRSCFGGLLERPGAD
jgi:hypothetical protein